MELVLLEQAKKDRDDWKQTGDERIMKRITELINDTLQHPFTGIGKPRTVEREAPGEMVKKNHKRT